MICPRCGNEWDATKSPCTRCGLAIRLPNYPGAPARTSPAAQTAPSRTLPPGPAQPNLSQSGPLSTTSPSGPSWSVRGSTANSNSAGPSTLPNTPRPFQFTAVPMPHSPAPTVPTSTPDDIGIDSNLMKKAVPRVEPMFGQVAAQPLSASPDPLTSKNVPHRPTIGGPEQAHLSGLLTPEVRSPSQSHLHASRLVTDPLNRDIQNQQASQQSAEVAQPAGGASSSVLPLLPPGTLLRNERYRLQELLGGQEWLSGVYEAVWVVQDAQRPGVRMLMSELMLPTSNPVMMQSTLRVATMALTSIGRHPRIPTLWDAFSDRGRSFFVFEPIEGESLLGRMRRTGRTLPEQDVIECCLQMVEILELLAQQSPPMVHGFIRPEHIIIGRVSTQYILTNFALVLAGGATQYVAGIDRSRLSPYVAPEFVRGVIDSRSDLYSLMATAYHAVTGSIPISMNGMIPQAQRLNPHVSAQFDAILTKGLSPLPNQRYQRPSELRQDLLAMRSVSSTLIPGNEGSIEPVEVRVQDSVARTFQSLAVTNNEAEERKLLLPVPEELPPLAESNDTRNAALWVSLIVAVLVILVVMSQHF